jgi:hypothetical protein
MPAYVGNAGIREKVQNQAKPPIVAGVQHGKPLFVTHATKSSREWTRAPQFIPRILRKPMNSASQNFPKHLATLRERMSHPTDFELAVHYFLEEFAGDGAFVKASEPKKMPYLIEVLTTIVSEAVGKRVDLEGALVSYLREHRFMHGNARADGRIVLFFYFEEEDAGMVMLIPGVRGEGDVMRFRTKGMIAPERN